VSAFSKIGALAAIAALLGLAGGPITARPPGYAPAKLSSPAAVFALVADNPVLVANQAKLAQDVGQLAEPTATARSSSSSIPSQKPSGLNGFFAVARPGDGLPPGSVKLAGSPGSEIQQRSAVSISAAYGPFSFRLDHPDALIEPRATIPLVRGPYDRLSPDYPGVPPSLGRAPANARDDRRAVVQTAPDLQAAEATPVLASAVVGPESAPQIDRASKSQTMSAAGEDSPARVRNIAGDAFAAAVPVSPLNFPIASGSQTGLPEGKQTAELAPQQQQNFDIRPGTRTFPVEEREPAFNSNDELILQVKIKGFDATDTVIAYGTREAVYLPVGELAHILDLAIRVSDDGNYAKGWFLDETRTLVVNLREQTLMTQAGGRPLKPGDAQAFDGEMFLRSELFGEIFPLEMKPDLRAQAIYLATLEPFPFEERMRRDAERAQLGAREGRPELVAWPRQETPWLVASTPMADIELRAVSDSAMGSRIEGDLRLGGDLAFMTAQTYFSATTKDGLVASLIQMGRRDAQGDLLGPLEATDFQFGDVATSSMPLGLRGQTGRGAYVTNRPFQNASVFEQIDLRGILPNGYEVELYRNDILVGSIAIAANDQYEFLAVPVDYGINVFRLVFYGPQGQRREEIRRVTVGDGRLAARQFEYDVSVVQRGENLLGVQGPNFTPIEGFGSWQAAARLSYGLNANVTAVTSLAYFEEEGGSLAVATAGLRTGLGALAIRADGAFGIDGSTAIGAGIGGRILGGGFSVSHFEYGGGFRDEIRINTRDPLRRATELDFNGNIKLVGQSMPIAARVRHAVFENGRSDTSAIFRNSFRMPGVVMSNTMEYSRNASPDGPSFSQLIGSFDLNTLKRSRVQMRASVGYSLLQGPEITNGSLQIAYQVDDRTTVTGQGFHSFQTGEFGFGASAVREFDKFTVAIDGSYAVEQRSYSVALRLGLSFGRDPSRRKYFVGSPGQASSGAVSLRAFQDMDGNGTFSAGDVPIKDAQFNVFNNNAATDERGLARLTRLGNGNPVAVQVDVSSLPDIMMAPASRAVEIVPRAGRIHVMDFPIVALSEIEGTVVLEASEMARGVSGLRLQLQDALGHIVGTTRTERGGAYFFEQVKPGRFKLTLDPEQAQRMGICLVGGVDVIITPKGDIYKQDANIRECR